MKLKKLLIMAFTGMVAGVVVLTALLLYLDHTQGEIFRSLESRYISNRLADELRQSSDDLTRMARTYVVTGDEKYEKMYWHILDIRNGKKPRPVDYDKVYWDLVLDYGDKPRPDGEAIALQQLMRQAGFSEEEFELLRQAQNNSDELVKIETIAMNAVKGLFDDGNGNFTVKGEPDLEMARRIMHDARYHEEKASIMDPINQFLQKVDARTQARVDELSERTMFYHRVAVWLAVIMVVLFILTGYYVIRKTWKILGCEPASFAEAARRVAEGDLTFAMEEICPEMTDTRKDGILSNAVSTMLEALKEQTQEINSTLASAVSQMSSTASQLASSATETSSTITQVGGTVEEVRHIAHKANETTREVIEDSQRMREVSTEGSEASQKAEDSMRVINTEMERVAETIIRLSEQTQNIGEIVEAVNDIADQSNLLSINASIEASKAGEFGKGFAVVAQEMKDLTEQSKVATAKIGSILGEIQQSTGSAVMAAERGGKAVAEGMELAVMAGISIGKLAESVENASTVVEQIGASSKQQLTGMDQLVDAMDNIKSASDQNADGTRQLQNAALQLRTLVEQLGNRMKRG